MIRQRHFAIAFLAFLVTPASITRADVADPFRSTFDSCLSVCPAGDLTFHVLLRTANSSPKPLATVDIEFCQCPGVTLCALTGTESYTIVSGCMVEMVTDANGVADFHIRAGGTCNGAAIRIFADSQLMRTLTAVSSPDQNGDTTVDAADQSILAAKMSGPYDPTGDFNCSQSLDPGDQAILAAHLGHSCSAAVPVRPGSWGRMKTLYR